MLRTTCLLLCLTALVPGPALGAGELHGEFTIEGRLPLGTPGDRAALELRNDTDVALDIRVGAGWTRLRPGERFTVPVAPGTVPVRARIAGLTDEMGGDLEVLPILLHAVTFRRDVAAPREVPAARPGAGAAPAGQAETGVGEPPAATPAPRPPTAQAPSAPSAIPGPVPPPKEDPPPRAAPLGPRPESPETRATRGPTWEKRKPSGWVDVGRRRRPRQR